MELWKKETAMKKSSYSNKINDFSSVLSFKLDFG